MKRFKFNKIYFLVLVAIVLSSCLFFFKASVADDDYTFHDNTVFLEDTTIVYPDFRNKEIKSIVQELIDKDLSKIYGSISYELKELKEGIINIFFTIKKEDGSLDYRSYLIDLANKNKLEIKDVLKDYESFNTIINTNLVNKYPYFLSEVVASGNGNISYLFKDNEVIIYYTNFQYFDERINTLSIKINYNDIKDTLDFSFVLDDIYTNENLFSLNTPTKAIALTFDDGPAGSNTRNILETLKKNHATATFFVQGYRLNGNKSVVQEELNLGNEIGNHTYAHKDLSKITKDEIINQIDKTNSILNSITNTETTLVRPPYGSINSKVIETVNHPIILWSIDSNDWKTKKPEDIVNNVLPNVCDGCIMLFHDTHVRSATAIEMLLPKLYNMGYQVVSVSKLAEIKGVTLENNKVYRYIK